MSECAILAKQMQTYKGATRKSCGYERGRCCEAGAPRWSERAFFQAHGPCEKDLLCWKGARSDTCAPGCGGADEPCCFWKEDRCADGHACGATADPAGERPYVMRCLPQPARDGETDRDGDRES